MAERVSARLSSSEGRKFAFTVGAAFFVLAGLVHWRGAETLPFIFAPIGAALFLAGVLAPAQLGPVQRVWMGLAHAISRITTPVLMGLVYYLTVMPIGLVMRARGYNPLVRAERAGGYWIERPADQRRSDMQRQF